MFLLKNTLSQVVALATLINVNFLSVGAQEADHAWNQPPTQDVLQSTPGLVHQTFQSQLMDTTIGYSVVLPASYDMDRERRFPVVFWLHGGGGNECSDLWTSRFWRQGTSASQTNEMILVYPNGGRSSYWDHFDGQVMMESVIVQELIPHFDRNFRSINRREARAVHGFSMGASGALKFAIKYPELFSAAVAYGGGAIDLERDKSPFIRKILERNLNSIPKLIQENNTYRILEANQNKLRRLETRFWLICGDNDSWKSSAVEFARKLESSGLECQLKLIPAVAHELGKLMSAEGHSAVRMQSQWFSQIP